MLTGKEIRKQVDLGNIKISPMIEENFSVNSYDVTLGNKIAFYALDEYSNFIERCMTPAETAVVNEKLPDSISRCIMYNEYYLDSKKENKMFHFDIPEDGFILKPNTLYLASVNEEIWSDKYVAELSGKSSLARLGITVHKTAEYANLGHDFKYILEIEVVHPVKIYPNMKIGQLYFHEVTGEFESYHGKYASNQKTGDIVGSLSYEDNK